MKFYQKRGFALVVLVLAILGSCVYGISKKPADLPQVSYGNWLRDDADLLTDETEASLRQYDQSWDSDYRAIIAVATLDTLNGWTYEKAAAELGSRWGLGGNDMLLLLVKDSDYYVALGDNVLDAMTDTYQAGLQGAVEAPYYQGDYDAAALAFFRQADVFELLTERGKSGEKPWDYIILDPPAFTKSGATVENARRGYREINRRAMQILPRGGYLATCSCSHFMTDTLFRAMLADAARDASVQLRQIEARTQSPDHPILWGVPETDYLKFYLFQVV